MTSIHSIVPEIGNLTFHSTSANRPLDVVRVVRLRGGSGWLFEDAKGRVYAAGRAAEIVNRNVYLIGIAAESGSSWGDILEGLVSLKKLTQAQLDQHREWAEKLNLERSQKSDLAHIRQICDRHGWAVNTNEAEQVDG